jgi:predicted membrane-bound spermidine synthase
MTLRTLGDGADPGRIPGSTQYDKFTEVHLDRVIVAIFFASGFAAIIYQIIWQRALFTIFGINVEAVTVVVTGFLFGLGFGSLSGGWLSRRKTIPLLFVFGLIELTIGAFGSVSLHVFKWAAARTLHLPAISATAITLVLVTIPTMFMGATLPILTRYFTQRLQNVGRSVGLLYSINTLGSATACFISAVGLMHFLGMQNSMLVAAGINVLVGAAGLGLAYWSNVPTRAALIEDYQFSEFGNGRAPKQELNLLFVCVVSVLLGYVSLSYEVIWFRAFLIGANQSQAFAVILGTYLAGLAAGSWRIGRYFATKPGNTQLLFVLCIVILISTTFGFAVLPLAARAASFGGWYGFVSITPLLIFVQTAIAGMAFPVLCHLGFHADEKAGFHLSLVYFSNILGSAAGTFITSFILMDQISTPQISAFLIALGAITAATVAGLAPMSWLRKATFIALGFIVVVVGTPFAVKALLDHYYERIIYKSHFGEEPAFVDVVENKSGVVTANVIGVVYGNGMYDGRAYVDLVDDKNFLIRPFSLALYHPRPREVLMIGLGSGSWAQVIVNNPEVERLTIVEINPGYRSVIAKFPAVMTILSNPKLEIIIDDGRRWMSRHPNRKFDAIIQNTTLNFRPNVTNLLSTEYLHLAGSHLREGGVLMYNTTGSDRAKRTGCTIFPYALSEFDVMVASNEPLQLDPGRLKVILESYTIDGHPAFDLSNPIHRARLDKIMAALDPSLLNQDGWKGTMESCISIESHTQGLPLITDDNMGEEWQPFSIKAFIPRRIISMFPALFRTTGI